MANISIRIDDEVKAQLQALVSELGMDITTFFTIAAKQAIREQRIPFDVQINRPNSETLEAIAEVQAMKKDPSAFKGYTDVDEMMGELLE